MAMDAWVGPSFTAGADNLNGSERIFALGPIPTGSMLDRIEFHGTASILTFLEVTAVLMSAQSVLEADLQAGQPLLGDHGNLVNGIPGPQYLFAANTSFDLIFHLGIPVTEGAKWVGLIMAEVGGAGGIWISGSLRVLERPDLDPVLRRSLAV